MGYEWEKPEASPEVSPEVSPEAVLRCPRCQGVLQTMDVHGHEQCALCHCVIEDCCQGAPQK